MKKKEENSVANDPDLSQLILTKLRPFQQAAFEFATSGTKQKNLWPSQGKEEDHDSAISDTAKDCGMVSSSPFMGQGRLLLADEMGLGKTVTSLAIMTYYRKEWPLLILCPASLRYTWPAEIEKFLPSLPASSIYVVRGFDDADFYQTYQRSSAVESDSQQQQRRRRNASSSSSIQIVVASYSILQQRSAAARALQEFQFQCVIADESQNLKSPQSQRTKLAMPLLQGAKRLLLLSGTPALARPVELWTQVSVLAPNLFAKNYTEFTKRYCNAHRKGRLGWWDVNGLSHAEELHSKLKLIMVRRLKNDVLSELPPKQRSIIPIQIPKGGKEQRECQKILEELMTTRQSLSELVGPEAESLHFEARRLLMQAYQHSGLAKSSGVCDFVVDWLRGSSTSSQKVLVFAHHEAVLDALENAVAKELKGVGHIRIDGKVGSQERATRVRQFQTSKKIRVAILSMTAAGVGLTLTAATNVFFAELHWTPGVLAQAEDRCHRIGQVNAVNIFYLVCRDPAQSIDMQLWNMLGRKVGNLGRVLDGQRNASMNADLVEDASRVKSAQEELQDFFADTATKNNTLTTPNVPVKGTITSFFKKMADNHNKTSPSVPKTEPVNSPPATCYPSDTGKSNTTSWNCRACTFLNTERITGQVLHCAICDTPFLEDDKTPSRTVTPSIPQKSMSRTHYEDQDTVVVDSDDDSVQLIERKPITLLAQQVPDEEAPMDALQVTSKQEDDTSNIMFSVSRNSGRISIHYKTGEQINFAISDVLTEACTDSLDDLKTRGKGEARLEFDGEAMRRLVNSLTKHQLSSKQKHDAENAIKTFLQDYLALRGTEKLIIQDQDRPLPSKGLKRIVAAEVFRNKRCSTTERYGGGAKERARERKEAGIADANDIAVLEKKLCAWCGGEFPPASKERGVEATYCSRDCADEGRLRRGGMGASTNLRAQIFALENGVCVLCKTDAHALYTRIRALAPAERLNALLNSNYKLPTSSKALDRLLSTPQEGDFWQVDHIIPVSEGGGDSSIDNLRTLCDTCHQKETAKLKSRLRFRRGGDTNMKRQKDIRSLFPTASAAKKLKINS